MGSPDRWLGAQWPFVRDAVPSAPASVVEIGCGSLGGFVPRLRNEGHDAVGIDPEAPEGDDFQRIEFERAHVDSPIDAVVASVSLHHVKDLGVVLDGIATVLRPGGRVIVLEWAWERFDLPTAEWGFDRVEDSTAVDHPGWPRRHQQRWVESGQPWESYLPGWAASEALHRGDEVVQQLDTRFTCHTYAETPYLFPDLADTTMADEQAAIDTGRIRATGIRYVGVAQA